MTYVNITGKNIGECLTGFGSSYPVIVYNNGNSDVEYTIDVENNINVFSVSDSKFVVNNGSNETFYIFYKPTIAASVADEIADITIFGQSIEDGTVDPSGLITIKATGSRIINNTAGAVRKFVALKNYDIDNGVNYDFSWFPPTGTGNLKNYYFTGYRLDISTSTNFSASTVYSEDIFAGQNTTDNPRFGTFYGFPNIEFTKNISKKEYPSLDLNIPYYARIYTLSTNNTGISIYATGIESVSEQLSEEVINGNSGTLVNIEFEKKALNVYVQQGNYYNYNLSQKIIETNKGLSDFTFYSGLNIYFSENSSFSSRDENSYAIDLNNVVLKNFTGDANTFINFYIPYNCSIIGNFGKGGDIITSDVWANTDKKPFIQSVFNKTTAEYNKINPTLSDSKAGGNVFKLDAKTDKNATDFIYNIYTEKNSLIAAGGGGNKAGVAEIAGVGMAYGLSSDNLIKGTLYQLNGAFNKYGINTKYDLFRGQASEVRNGGTTTTSAVIASFFSNKSEYGEDGSNSFYFKYLDTTYNGTISFKSNTYYRSTVININDFTDNFNVGGLSFISMPGSVSQAGNLIKKYSNSSIRYSLYNTDIPADYLFRLENSFLTSSSSWVAKNYIGSTIFTLNTPSATGVSYNPNFNSTEYRALTITNGSLSGLISSSSTCKNFDLFIVGCFSGTMTPPKTFSLINWYANIDKISKTHVNFKQFTDTNVSINNVAEPNTFNFFTSLLYNYKIENQASKDFFLFNKGAENSYYQLSKCLNTNSLIIYPFVLNIKRTGTVYTIYVNGNLHTFYDLNFNTESSARNITNFISEILSTTFKLENSDAAMSTSFFDILCYNRVLFDDESRKVNNHLLQNYIKLFTGVTSNSYLNITDRIRFPNTFNLAGKISSIP